jgi:hypothetical protein
MGPSSDYQRIICHASIPSAAALQAWGAIYFDIEK